MEVQEQTTEGKVFTLAVWPGRDLLQKLCSGVPHARQGRISVPCSPPSAGAPTHAKQAEVCARAHALAPMRMRQSARARLPRQRSVRSRGCLRGATKCIMLFSFRVRLYMGRVRQKTMVSSMVERVWMMLDDMTVWTLASRCFLASCLPTRAMRSFSGASSSSSTTASR